MSRQGPCGSWRAMTPDDLAIAYDMSKIVHPGFPEDFSVMAEKVRLFPAGCFFAEGFGYAVSHPWAGPPPPLNRPLGALPAAATHHYIHDVAILPAARGAGLGAAVVAHIRMVAAGLSLSRLALVAVNNSVPFWLAQGFALATLPPAKLASYGPDARYMQG